MQRASLSGIALGLLSFAALSPAQSQDAATLAGTFCGQLQTMGVMVRATTILEVAPNGGLVGRYDFEDNGAKTTGTLVEKPRSKGLKRTFVWTDVYGTGELAVTFSADGHSFSGLWGADYEPKPDEPWNGTECVSN